MSRQCHYFYFFTINLIFTSLCVLASNTDRANLITKSHFENNRQRKSNLPILPKPFIVRSEVYVTPHRRRQNDASKRGGRQFQQDEIGNVVVVEGIRMPDDPSDKVQWRNGRVINNMFLPYEEDSSSSSTTPKRATLIGQLNRKPKSFGALKEQPSFYHSIHNPKDQVDVLPDTMAMESKINEVYALPDTVSSQGRNSVLDEFLSTILNPQGPPQQPPTDHVGHGSKHSPYVYEQVGVDHLGQPTETVDKQEHEYVIKEHTYTMCPGCPTFNIPVPIFKSALKDQDNSLLEKSDTNKTFFQRIGHDIASKIKELKVGALNIVSPIIGPGESTDQLKRPTDKSDVDIVTQTNDYVPVMFAGAAALALGGLAVYASGFENRLIPTKRAKRELQINDENHKIIRNYIKHHGKKYT